MQYLLGIDLGTSSVKVLLMDIGGRVIAVSQEDYGISVPHTGWAEQSPEEWWKVSRSVIKKVLIDSRVDRNKVQGIGLSGQMHGMVPLDQKGNVIRPAIIWADQRTREQTDRVRRSMDYEMITKTTLNAPATGFYAMSLLWVKEKEPDNYRKIFKAILPKDYIRYKLTRKIGTDTTDASGTLAFDARKRAWSYELIRALDLNSDIFPECHESWEIAGELQTEVAEEIGLAPGTAVVYGGGDHSMQCLGNGIINPGTLSLNIGTGSQVSSPVKQPLYDPLLRMNTFCHVVPNTWSIMGASLNGGLALKWIKNNMFQEEGYSSIDEMAEKVNSGSDGLIFLPYLVGERSPHQDPDGRGIFFGLTLKHDKSYFYRAVMEGVIYSLRDSIDILAHLDIKADKVVSSGGGARSRLWLQIQADILDREIYVSNVHEQACLGAAITAGVGAGVYKSFEEGCKTAVVFKDEVVEPLKENVKVYNNNYEIYKQLYIRNKDMFPLLEYGC
jgi:xylulokinase